MVLSDQEGVLEGPEHTWGRGGGSECGLRGLEGVCKGRWVGHQEGAGSGGMVLRGQERGAGGLRAHTEERQGF